MRLLCLTRGEYWEPRIRRLGVPITWAGVPPWRVARLYRIVSALAEDTPDLIQSHHFYTNLYAAAAARTLGAVGVGAVRNDAISEVRANGPVLGRLSLRSPRWIAANSGPGVRNAVSLGVPSGRIRLLPNVVDIEQFSPPPAGRDRSDGQDVVRILAVGRLERQKRFDRLLALLARLRSRSSARFVARIVGNGSLRPQLEAQAVALGLAPGTVEFQPSTEEIPLLYRMSDVLVLTSDWEGTPNVVLEAMASGLPVAATDVGGVADLVRHGVTGLLAAPEDEGHLLENLAALVENANFRAELGANARDFVVAHHSLAGLPALLGSFYGSLFEPPESEYRKNEHAIGHGL